MPVSPARQVAFRILCRVEDGRGYAVDMLQQDDVSRLGDADRRLATEIVMGVLRWRGELDSQIQRLSGKPLKYFDAEVTTILRMGVYQMRFLEKIPPSAAVNEAVKMTKAAKKRSAAALVNAVLRKCRPPTVRVAASSDALRDPEIREAVERSLPRWLFERWARGFGRDAALALAFAGVQIPPTTLRVASAEREEIQQPLLTEGIRTEPGRFSGRALVVRSGNVQASQLLERGEVVIQDEASQLVVTLVAPRASDRVLDLCAAPGIKTSQLARELGQGTLVACDVSGRRLGSMKRLVKSPMPLDVTCHFLRLDATRPLPLAGEFGRILVDAPCSGTGTLARNPEIKWRLRPNDLPRLAEIQTCILRNALSVLAPGGRLVYATCSLEPEENENVIEEALAEYPECRIVTRAELAEEFPVLAELLDACGYLRTRPDLHGTDGFFAAVILRERR